MASESQKFHVKDLKQKHDSELDKIFVTLIQSKNALYHPETKKKLFIVDGCCVKGECNFSGSFGVKKVLLPESAISDFREEIPIEKIGQLVVCFSHFFFAHQKHYLVNGSFPEEVRLLRVGENNWPDGKPIPPPRPFKKDGFKISSHAWKKDNDWVSKFIAYLITFIVKPFYIFDRYIWQI